MPSHDPPIADAGQPPPDDRGKRQVEVLVAACIEAMERGDADPVPRICADHPDLTTRVQRKLAQLVLRGLIPGVALPPPTAIGPYRILSELGSGGMGTVWLAEQQEPVRRQVAVKVIKLGMDTREVVARFSLERQTLAAMSHPHIAQVLEAGATDDGRPYFVMEYVDGRPITAFCDERRLAVGERLRLFATVCRAVQHANDRGVIHRDLKPSNILVAEHAGHFVPKIIDFGVAKATEAAAAQYGLQTRADQVLGTPEYMSPEHASSGGIDVDVRTDVYSLGVVLYELLCGGLPFESQRLRASSRRELERILAEEPPAAPSTRLQQADASVLAVRGLASSWQRARASRELDWIALRALAKVRGERYASAAALADDVERWLRHEPVLAAPPGLGYRLRKFVRRHRVPVAAGAAVFAALGIGLVMSLDAAATAREAQRQEAAALADVRSFYGLARDAVARMVDVADRELARVPRADTVRRTMLGDALAFYAGLQERRPTDPSLRVDILAAQERVGALQRRLGQAPLAAATLSGCATAVDGLLREFPGDVRLLRLRGAVQGQLGAALGELGQGAAAVAAYEAALAAFGALRAAGVDTARALDHSEAGLLTNLALELQDRPEAASGAADRSLAAWQRVRDAAPDDPDAVAGCARALALRAKVHTRRNELAAAAADLQQAEQLLAALPPDAPDVREQAANAASQFAGVLRRLDRPDEARAAQLRSIDLLAALAREHPDVAEYEERQAGGCWFVADLARARGDREQARAWLDRAIALRRRLVAAHPETPGFGMQLVRTLQTQASILVDDWQHHGGRSEPALEVLAAAVAEAERLRQGHPEDVEVGIAWASVYETRGAIRDGLGDREAALADHTAARTELSRLLARGPDSVGIRAQLATVCSNLVTSHWYRKDFAAAAAVGDEGIGHVRAGLAMDARHDGLLTTVPTLVVRTAMARQADGDFPGAIRTLLLLLEVPEFDAAARETGAMTLAEFARDAGHEPGREDLLLRAERELRGCIAFRAARPPAAATDGERDGSSLAATRQRDLDLRIKLAEVLDELDQHDALSSVVDEELQLVAAMPKLAGPRARAVYDRAVQCAARAQRWARCAELVEELSARVGPDGGACYLCAVLFARTAESADAALAETCRRRAVECLALALEKGEVDRRALAQPDFAGLARRADYLQLLEK